MTANPNTLSGFMPETGELPRQHVNVVIGADGQMRFSGHSDAVAQTITSLQPTGGEQPSVAMPQPRRSGENVTTYDTRSHLNKFIGRHAGTLALLGATFIASTATYSALRGENLFTHPAEFSQPIHQVKSVIHFFEAI